MYVSRRSMMVWCEARMTEALQRSPPHEEPSRTRVGHVTVTAHASSLDRSLTAKRVAADGLDVVSAEDIARETLPASALFS